MRTIIGFLLVSAVPAFAQVQTVPVFPSYSDYWKPLREYLQLTGAQERAISDASSNFYFVRRTVEDRRFTLADEIRLETAKSPLQPTELGRLHKEWETIRRDLVAAEKQRNAATRTALNDAQKEKLRLLDEMAAQRTTLGIAVDVGLLPVDCAALSRDQQNAICTPPLQPSFNDLPYWRERPGDDDEGTGKLKGYPYLVRFLALTDEQQAAIDKNRSEVFGGREIIRIRAVLKEITEETARENVDALALGLRYAEVEALRRAVYQQMRTANSKNLEVLRPDQRTRFSALEEAVRLHDTVDEARRVDLLGSRCTQSFVLLLGAC